MPTNKKTAIKGVAWSTIERFSVQGVQFLVSIVLARMLTPSDFGLVAIVLVFSNLFRTINESGFNIALMHKLDRDDLDFSTIFYANVIIGFFSYIILFIIAPFIADFYDSPNFTMVMRVLSLTVIINAIGLVQTAKYTISIDFKTIARASLTAAVLSGIFGITYAYYYRNIYAIVFQSLLFNLIYVILMWLYAKWHPLLSFSIKRFRILFDYAYKLILARLISVVFDDIYSLAIGKIYTPASLGLYNRATSFREVLSRNILNSIQRVSVPMLCEAQESNEQMQKVLLKFLTSTALIVYPMLTGLLVLAKPLVLVVLGEKWSLASEFIYYTCPIGFFYMISTFNRNVFNATGRTDWALKAEIIKKTLFILVFLLTMKYDIRILLIGLLLIAVFEMLIDTYFSYIQIHISLFTQIKSLAPVILASIVMGICIFAVTTLFNENVLKLIIGFIVGIISYISFCFALNIYNVRDEIKKVFRM